jgi:hypothetical protein
MKMNEEQVPRVSVTPALRLLYTSSFDVDPPILVGLTHHGERRIIHIKGGAFEGPRLSGKVLPGGADWQIIHADGVTELEARYTLETHDGALIYVINRGIRSGPKEVMDRLAKGENVDPKEYYFRTAPVFETAAQKYAWLNTLVAVAAGERYVNQVIVTVYEVT